MSEHKSPTPTPVALGSSKINASHHQRLAYVYIRQSTTQQVEHHKGSQINLLGRVGIILSDEVSRLARNCPVSIHREHF